VQARERNDKRARILDAAGEVFAERGYFSSTVAEIARAAGVADGTIYLYFKSKDDLLLRLFDEKMTQLLAEAKAALAEERDAPSRLKRFIQLQLLAGGEEPRSGLGAGGRAAAERAVPQVGRSAEARGGVPRPHRPSGQGRTGQGAS